MTAQVSQPLTLGRGIRAAAARQPDKIAIRFGGSTMTYAELIEKASRLSALLAQNHGVAPGDRVALVARNCPEYVVILMAVSDLGAASVLINPRQTGTEVATIIADCEPKLVIVEDDLATQIDRSGWATSTIAALFKPELLDCWSDAAPSDMAREHEPFAMHYTSGTTGQPKGVPISHRSRTLSFLGMASEYGCYGPDDHFLAVAPLCHGAGLAFALAALYTGGCVTLIDQFDPQELINVITQSGITGLFLVPTHFKRIFALPDAALAELRHNRLKALISNAAPLHQADKERVIDLFGEGRLFECYGATESGIITNLRPDMHRQKHDCVGTPFVATEVELRGEDGTPVADGEVGELFSRSPYLFDGYWQRPMENTEGIVDGWVSVGDLARRDADGFYYIVDRKKDMIISGGINIYPREIEAVLLQHPAIADVAVIGLPDPLWGEAVHAEIVLRGDNPLSLEDIKQFSGNQLSAYKLPKSISLVDEIARNANGKILKTVLRQKYGDLYIPA
jgi:long-chain acyl-CoA synthetase